MKNLKRLMSVVLCVAMLMSFVVSTSAATFSDVEESNGAYAAVEVLSALEILTGRDDGTFDPDAEIKRSEFAAVVCRAMNQEATAQGSTGFSKFADVSTDHWAVGYINWAAQAGIVNGRDANTFDADAPVSYQEAVKMLVCALGFGPYASVKGGYPTGYMTVAAAYGVTSGVAMTPATGNATRAGVAQLTFNTLDAPLMDAATITFGDDVEYVIYDGGKAADYEKRTLLSQERDMYKVKAAVTGTYKTNADDLLDDGVAMVELKAISLYKFDEDDTLNGDFAEDEVTAVIINDLSYADYLGYTVNAYVFENEDGDYEVAAMIPDVKSVEKIEIDNVQLASLDATFSSDELVIEYEIDNDVEEVEFVKYEEEDGDPVQGVVLYVNGAEALDGDFISDDNDDEAIALIEGASKLVLMGNKSVGAYDKVFITNYAYAAVEEIDLEAMSVEVDNSDIGELLFAEDDNVENFSYTIYKDGAEIALEDLAEGDLLNIIAGGDIDEPAFLEIYVTNNVIESSLSEIDEDEGIYVIDNKDYRLAPGASLNLYAGATGRFIITIDGYLYDADLTSSTSDNYAFIIDVDYETGASFSNNNVWQVKLLTKDNKIEVLDVKSTLRVTAWADEDESRVIYEAGPEQDDLFEAIQALLIDEDADTVKDNLYRRLVTYKVSSDKITDLTFAKDSGDDREFVYGDLAAEYKASTNKLGANKVAESTVLFATPVSVVVSIQTEGDDTDTEEDDVFVDLYGIDEDDVQIYATSSLAEDLTYTGFVFNVVDRTVGAAILDNEMPFAGKKDAMAVVKSISDGVNENGDPATIITFFQGGEDKKLVVDDELDLSAYAKGDVFHYTATAAGVMNAAILVYDLSEKDLAEDLDDDDYAYVAGLVEEKDGGLTLVDAAAGFDGGVDLEDGCTNVEYLVRKNTMTAKTGISYIKAYKENASGVNAGTFNSDAYVVVAKTVDGDVVDLVAYLYDNVEDEVAVDDFIAEINDAILA